MARDSDADGMEPEQMPPTPDQGKDRISGALKQVYDSVANEPLPDDLAALLEKLKSGTRK